MANKVKAKTHKGLSKVIKVRKGGSIKFQPAKKLHQTANRSNASRRRRHKANELSGSDYKRVKSVINK